MAVHRSGVGEPLVWIHGLGESSVSFEPVIAMLPGFEHTLVDLPGYGRSDWGEPSGLEHVADRLAGWLRERPLATLIGHSMGGVLTVMLAERGVARRIVDVDGNLTRGDCTFSAQACAYSEAEFIEHGFAEMRAQVYERGVTELPLRSYHAAMCFASPAQFYKHACELVELSSTNTMTARLAALAVPSLFIAGVPRGICEASKLELERHRVRWLGIEPAGHWVYLDQLAMFAGTIDHFVSGASAAGRT
jgi:pimeloyl-ACP methyl ester carboxylesterase